MSITQRILEGAQSGMSRLTSLVIVDDEPLSHVESAALQAELTARKAAREKAAREPLDNPLAKLATSDSGGARARDRAAKERAARIHRERDERAARQKAAADEAFRRMKEQAARGGAGDVEQLVSARSRRAVERQRARRRGRAAPRPRSPSGTACSISSVGADMAQIKTAYRQLMRKYHPDMHAGNPQKQKAATELSCA